jgi:tRNA-dihydrouridine synthase B
LKQVIHFLKTGHRLPDPTLAEQHRIVREHYREMIAHYGAATGVKIARKHVAWYSKGLHGSAEFRVAINRVDEPSAAERLIDDFYAPLLDRQAA